MFIVAVILGIIIGIARRGKINRLSYIHFNMSPLIYISVLLYICIIIMNLGLLDYASFLYNAFLIMSYALIFIFIIVNLDIKFMFVTLIGLCSNVLCFLVNGFKFPMSSNSVSMIYGTEIYNLLINGKIKFFIPAENSSLSFLGSIITLGNYKIVSIGDIIISLGIVLIVQAIISDKYLRNKSNITFSKKMFK
ncbi:hypothetical protein J2Z76_002107 [Sedimentibacter acidaminivorans]|uniref:Uncharacterized protein n=1 Tax=Sedimentibacter acidaminivorans TaxID=913099 RepID=A0ABS4GEX2_9FIRM|nr:DUF5317 family protein [Sedimentibacter acidaminivorans]MBP1926242.1 hypothetical protein [Sedimentibacter acidaminivorans]